jgi:hypothetical protein
MTTVWHTDIVVEKQGMNVKIKPSKKGCYRVELMPDVQTKAARAAHKKFQKAMNKEPRACGAHAVKRQVQRAIKATKAIWNRWHKESY